MKIGVSISNYGDIPNREFLINAAKKTEENQLDSIWTSDHIIVPKQNVPWTRVFETISTLSFFASITEKITLGTSILVVPLRDPIVLAKQIATLDALSNGRVMIGVGVGSNQSEFEFLSKDFTRRGSITENNIKIMRKFWEGGHTDQGFISEPSTTETKGPNILVGGQSKSALMRAASFGDGWHPSGIAQEEYEAGINKILEINDRDYIWSLRVGFAANKKADSHFVGSDGNPRLRLTGNIDGIKSEIEKFEKIGLNHIICDIRENSAEECLKQIDILGEIKKSF
jgi:alkanesulfonate monooxygenase SsuD/methylene tetrahydromethanopterin reductase-like flavin-dependent oxidoreductase (luciferase family)